MRKTVLLAVLLCLAGILSAQECFFTPTETRYWDQSKSYNGYTLFGSGGTTYLVDMEGHVVHSWKIGTNPRFTEGGTLLDAVGGDPSNSNVWKELDWNGNVVWTYTEKRSNYHPHHDFVKIYNPKLGDSTFMYIANKDYTAAQCLAAGANPASSSYTGVQLDVVVEVNRAGRIIWEWAFFDHIVQEFDATKTATYGVVKNTPGRININMSGNPLKSDWLHCNSMDYNEQLDQVVINSVHGEFYVIDHGNTFLKNDSAGSIALAASSKGDFLYRFGDPAKYGQGSSPSFSTNPEKTSTGHKQIGGAHDIQWIKSGLPGAGNFLVFNNGQNLFELTPQSYIVEINPYLNASGVKTSAYVNPPDAGYNIVNPANSNLMKEKKNISKQVVWNYSSKNNTSFFSTIGSSAQRLPNGNTFVCAMNSGHFFEVYPTDTSVVWEYINPFTRTGIRKIKTDTYPTDNAAFRAYRYTADHPALVGHDLTPGATMTGFDPDYFIPANVVAIKKMTVENPVGSSLEQNYPNPFNATTTIDFKLDAEQRILASVYDLSGMKIKTLADHVFDRGENSLKWDGTDDAGNKVPRGLYFYVLRSKDKQMSKKMIYNPW
jgi:hypothetical protein